LEDVFGIDAFLKAYKIIKDLVRKYDDIVILLATET
jgi:hypothetical protein